MEKERTIRVTGKGNLKVHPDMTRVTIDITRVYREYSETLKRASMDTKALRILLSRFGFEHSDLKTVHFSVDTEMETYREDDVYKQRLIGYRYTHSTKIEVDSDNERRGKILYALAHSSLEPKFRLSYTVKDPEAVKNNLLSRAVKDAKEKAKILTAAADVELGEILSIDYSWREITFEAHPLQLIEDKMLCSEPMASYDLDIEPDDISASDTVTIIWEIKQK